jgi:hypothetical protein
MLKSKRKDAVYSMKKCIIIRSEWKIINGWAPAYAEAFRLLGYEVFLADSFTDVLKILSCSIKSGCEGSFEFLLTFSGFGIEQASECGLSIESLGIPLVSLYIDHPENTAYRLCQMPANSFAGLFDRGDIIYARKYINSQTRYFFLTDAGLEHPDPLPGFDERDIDVLFCGTIPSGYQTRDVVAGTGRPNLLAIFDKLTDMLLTNDKISPYTAFEKLCNDAGFDFVPDGTEKAFIHSFLSLATHYVRGRRRIALLRTLLDSELKIACVGDSNQTKIFNSPNLEVLDAMKLNTFGEGYLKMIRRAKVTINTSPLSQYALSERQPTSMLNGALVVSDMNPYMDIYFKDNRDLIAYSHSDYSTLPERIRQVMCNREKWAAMTQSAYAAAKEHHTFINRAKEILQVLHSGF